MSLSLPIRLFPQLRAPWKSHRLRHGRIVDPTSGTVVDDAMGVIMPAPASYTGEDVFEIHCHGSPLVLERVVAICLREGCRPARPGEFTLRAFLNGRLDLSQAEAVVDVVRARGNAGLELALQQLTGSLSRQIEPIYSDLMGTLAHMEALVDFVEEDIPPQLDDATRTRLAAAREGIIRLLGGIEQGIVYREGASLCIVGSPNVGKSSIMNGLLGLDRSIVTPIPGTTRDTVEETLQVRGIPFRVVDTAGIRDTHDTVERIGVERSRRSLETADVVLLVLDRSRSYEAIDAPVLTAVEESRNGGTRRLVVALNKADLPAGLDPEPILARVNPYAAVESSALAPGGLDALREALESAALGGVRREVVTGNVRHHDALRRAHDALQTALDGLDARIPLDLVVIDVRAAAWSLGEITGASVDDELLDRIFRDFCIGK